MRDYELKRGHWKNIDGDKLVHLMQDVFQENPQKDGNGYAIHNYGALTKLYAEQLGKTHLRVDTVMNPKVPAEEAQKTMRAWNDFLELATGYNAKERGKRAQAEAKKAGGEDVEDIKV
ncbi:MAG TPA: DUF5611 family protein [Candidatus Thermoplasmatota archaeon]|nr:DUF5611 family protein [Candidatus Thermoplasmatota archaeon]